AVVLKSVGQPGLPVVRVHNMGHKFRDCALADLSGDSSERSETNGVVGPTRTIRRGIWVTRTCEQMRRVEYEQVKVSHGTAENTRGSSIIIFELKDFVHLTQRVQHIRISWHHGARLDPFRPQSLGQSAGHISEAAG